MILHQFYLNCLAHASYLIGDEQSETAAVVDPQRDVDQYLSFAAEHGLSIRHVILTHFHADFIAGHLELHEQTWRDHSPRALRAGGVRLHAIRRRRQHRVRRRAAGRARNTWSHPGVDLDPRVRPRGQRLDSACRADRETRCSSAMSGDPICARRWDGRPTTSGSLLYDSLHGKLLTSARLQPGLSRARRRLVVREGALEGDGLDDRRTAPDELRASTTQQGSLHRAGDDRSARCAVVFHLRRGAQQPQAADAQRGAHVGAPAARPRRLPRASEAWCATARHARRRRVRGRAPEGRDQHRARRLVRDVGRAASSIANVPSSSLPTLVPNGSPRCVSGGSGSTT